MKSFFHTIWGLVLQLWGAVKWTLSIVSCGPTVRLPENEGVEASLREAFLPPPEANSVATNPPLPPTGPKPRSWLDKVEKVFLHVRYVPIGKKQTRKQTLRVDIYLPNPLTDRDFQDLQVIVFLEGQENGVTYAAKPRDALIFNNGIHSVPLEPVSGVNAFLTIGRVRDNSACATNVGRVELLLGDESIVLNRQPSGFFTPRRAEAA